MGVLDGQAIVVTGAGRGLGEAYAIDASRAGASVVVNDIDRDLAEVVAERIRADGGAAVADGSSVGTVEGANAIVGVCVSTYSRIDGIVNNAGLLHHRLLWEEDVAKVAACVQVNLLGTFFCSMAAVKEMRKVGRGAIVNAYSRSAWGRDGAGIYGATKAAIQSLTYTWSIELEPLGVRVNAIAPSARTRMVAGVDDGESASGYPAPERIAPLSTYLLSDRSARFSGQIVRFDGRKLSLITPSHEKEPVLERDYWTVEDVDCAFTDSLIGVLEPFGLYPHSPRR